jgi:hypothetical protein
LEVQKDIDIYRSRQEQIGIIEKRRQLPETRKNKNKHDKRTDYEAYFDI